MGKFREKMDQDMRIRGFTSNTRKAYLGSVSRFVRYFMRSPDELTIEDVNQYQLYLTKERGLKGNTCNQNVAAIRFFYNVTLKNDWDFQQIPFHKSRKKLPVILSKEEVVALLDALSNPKHRAIFETIYSGGFRVSEVTHLRVADIDSQRMMIRIRKGKGDKARYVMLSEQLLKTLRTYYKSYRLAPQGWLFPGRYPTKPLNRSSVLKVLKKAKKSDQISKPITVHSLRHSFATHLLEDGTNIRVIQRLLGHKSLRSTEVYTHVAENYITETKSPLDNLPQRKVHPDPSGSKRC